MTKKMKGFRSGSGLNTGAAFLAVLGFAAVSHAGIIVGNLGATAAGSYSPGSSGYVEEEFTPSQNTTLGSVTLNLNFSAAGSGTVDLYNITSGLTPVGTIGTVSSSSSATAQNYTIGGLNFALVSGDKYGVALTSSSSAVSWNYTAGNSTSPGSIGTFDAIFTGGYGGSPGYDSSNSLEMELNSVPEVPMTGLAMGVGALAICGLDILRRKKAVVTQ
jgi:hypothetical protein